MVKNDEYFPADVVLLMTSTRNYNCCYIETKNIDGEVSMKKKIVNAELYNIYSADTIEKVTQKLTTNRFVMTYNEPSALISEF